MRDEDITKRFPQRRKHRKLNVFLRQKNDIPVEFTDARFLQPYHFACLEQNNEERQTQLTRNKQILNKADKWSKKTAGRS